MRQLVMTKLIHVINFSLQGELWIFFFAQEKELLFILTVESHHLLNTVAALNGQLENSAGSVLYK